MSDIETVNLKLYEHSTYRRRIDVTNPDGTPATITGFTARMEFREEPNGVLLHTSTSENSELTVGTTFVDIDLSGITIAGFNFDASLHDLFVIDAAGNPFAVMKGITTVNQSVTEFP